MPIVFKKGGIKLGDGWSIKRNIGNLYDKNFPYHVIERAVVTRSTNEVLADRELARFHIRGDAEMTPRSATFRMEHHGPIVALDHSGGEVKGVVKFDTENHSIFSSELVRTGNAHSKIGRGAKAVNAVMSNKVESFQEIIEVISE